MKSLKENVHEIINSLGTIIEKKIVEVKESEELSNYDMKYVKENLDEGSNLDDVLEGILNYYLDGIKTLNVIEYFDLFRDVFYKLKYKKLPPPYAEAASIIDDVLDYADTCEKYENVYEEAGYIACQLIRNKLGVDEFCLNEYVRIRYIRYYSVSHSIPTEEFYNKVWYIIIYVAVHYYVLKEIK